MKTFIQTVVVIMSIVSFVITIDFILGYIGYCIREKRGENSESEDQFIDDYDDPDFWIKR